MNQPPTRSPDTELAAIADAFESVLRTLPTSYSTRDRFRERLTDALTTVAGLAVRLDSQLNHTLTALSAAALADRPGHANTASDLTVVIGNAGRALNELAAAQDARLFIDHAATDYDRPEINTLFAQGRTITHLGTAREVLAESAERLRYAARRRAAEQRSRAAQARGPRKSTPTDRGSAAAAPAAPAMAPTTAKHR
jgi:hypothetical protein